MASSWDRKHNFGGSVHSATKKYSGNSRDALLRDMLAKSAEKLHDSDVSTLSRGLRGGSENSTFGNGYVEIVAPTSGGGRPRALKCGYAPSIHALIIVMRNDGPGGQDIESWILYENIYPEYWDALRQAYSTHTFVSTFLAGHSWSKIDPGNQPKARPDHFKDGQGE